MKIIGVALLFNTLDLISGLLVAVLQHNIMSSKLRDGLFKKSGFILMYVVAYAIYLFGGHLMFPYHTEILKGIVAYSVFTEVVSILENVYILNPNILPEKIMDLFHIKEV